MSKRKHYDDSDDIDVDDYINIDDDDIDVVLDDDDGYSVCLSDNITILVRKWIENLELKFWEGYSNTL